MKFALILLMFLIVTDGARRANNAYESGDFVAAEEAYREALSKDPDNARLHFNLGNALARQGKLEEALTAYQNFRDLAESPSDRALAEYNMGNIYGAMEKWDRAMEQFRTSLRNNPDDSDAKYNFELASRNQQQQMEQPDQQPGSGDSQGDDRDQHDRQSPDRNDADGNNDPDSEDQEQQNPDQQNEGQQPRPQPQSDLTPEEADRILNALENKEQDLLKDFHKNQIPSNRRHVRNW